MLLVLFYESKAQRTKCTTADCMRERLRRSGDAFHNPPFPAAFPNIPLCLRYTRPEPGRYLTYLDRRAVDRRDEKRNMGFTCVLDDGGEIDSGWVGLQIGRREERRQAPLSPFLNPRFLIPAAGRTNRARAALSTRPAKANVAIPTCSRNLCDSLKLCFVVVIRTQDAGYTGEGG